MNKSLLQINAALYQPILNNVKLSGYNEKQATAIASQISRYYAQAIEFELENICSRTISVANPNTTT